jgi:inhibitor of KinA sporulation pathway (predicted exonuclease)
MKKLARVLAHRRTLVFLDFEGTQQSHEMIAFAAIKTELNEDFTIKKSYKGIHHLVRPKKEVGLYVTKLTKITEIDVVDKGISFAKAMLKLRNYVGKSFNKSAFIIFGNHDVRILNQSFHHSPDADETIVKTITKNAIDFSMFLSEFIKDDKGNPLSLINNLAVFNVPFKGDHHHPLDDTKNLLNLYRQVISHKEIIIESYIKSMSHLRHVPEPVKIIIEKILKDEPVTKETFILTIKEYIG